MTVELPLKEADRSFGVPPRLAALLRPHLPDAVEEIIREIQSRIPEYSRPLDGAFGRHLRAGVEQALHQFVARIEDPNTPREQFIEAFQAIGHAEMSEGRSLDVLQCALRIGARVAWRQIVQAAEELDLPPSCLHGITEAIFFYLDEVAVLCAEGHAEAQIQVAGEKERRRQGLLHLLLADPPASMDAIAERARAAQWPLPETVAGLVLEERPGRHPVLPTDVLVDLSGAEPHLIVPDPDGPGRRELLNLALKGRHAIIGPTVPLRDITTSLAWARDARTLAQRGVIAGDGAVRCADHMSTLLLFADEDLVDLLTEVRLKPLSHLRSVQRDRLAETLLAWLTHGRNANEVAGRLHVHPQTVRYRLRHIEELFGAHLLDPDLRFELEIVLRARALKKAAN